jgi:GntR family transcriptional regulator
MLRALKIDPSDATPIWSQIEEGMRRLVASKALPPGAAVSSVRDLARDLSVNPATVARAYQRLTEAGIFTIRRGDGTYVADSPPPLPRGERDRALREGASRFASLAVTLGASAEDAARELAAAWRELTGGAKGARR